MICFNRTKGTMLSHILTDHIKITKKLMGITMQKNRLLAINKAREKSLSFQIIIIKFRIIFTFSINLKIVNSKVAFIINRIKINTKSTTNIAITIPNIKITIINNRNNSPLNQSFPPLVSLNTKTYYQIYF